MEKVMLIEDDPTMIELLGTLLEMEGYIPIKVKTFDSVLNDIAREKPGLVLMDIHLGDQDGLKILSQLRQNDKLRKARVIMTSGMDKRQESMQAGADDFLLKPYMPEELIEMVNGLIG